MRKILVLAYAVSPYRGSEYSVAWNYITHMSKDNELTVLYGVSDEHMGDISTMEAWLQHNSLPNVRFIAIKPNWQANALNTFNKHNFLVYSFYFAYRIWQQQVYQVAKKLIQKEHFDLIHYVGPIGYREPGYLWKLPLPYIWGPIGGFNNAPKEMRKALPLNGKIKLGIRALLNNIQIHTNRRVQQAIKRTDVLLTVTSEGQELVKKYFRKESIYLPENSITACKGIVNPNKFKDEKLKLIWIGRIDANKSLIILIEALSLLKKVGLFELHVVGDGPLQKSLIEKSKNKGLSEAVIWHGKVPREKVFQLLTNAHFHIITSQSEANTTVLWEAMTVGVPTITVDHCGMHDVICEQCGIKIPITTYEEIIKCFAKEISKLLVNRERWYALAEGTVQCAQKYTWDKRIEILNKCYDQAIRNYKNK